VRAEDGEQQEVEIATAFNLETAAQDEDVMVYSADGQAELYIPANTLSDSGVVVIEPAQMALTFPEDLYLLSGPYAIRGGDDLTLAGDATFSLRYLDQGDLNGFDTATAQIYRWDGAAWRAVETTMGPVHQIASTAIMDFGTYALLAERLYNVYLPNVLRAGGGVSQLAEVPSPAETMPEAEIIPEIETRVPALAATSIYTTTTDASGAYTLTGLSAGAYIVSPDPGGALFNPVSQTVSLPPNAVNQDFTRGGPIPGEMVTIPAGEFQMGCDPDHNGGYSCDSDEQPLHTVYLDAYAIDKYEVTNAEYAEFLNIEGNQEEGNDTWVDADDPDVRIYESAGVWHADTGYEDHSVIEVTWYGARAYCQWQGKRLPTEAEWEKAARGSSDTRMYPWGNEDPDCSRLNYYYGSGPCVGDTTQVGSYSTGTSPYGALDMAGNVWEWVNDWYAADYYSSSPYANPSGSVTGSYRVLRGGGWLSGWSYVRVAFRTYVTPSDSGHIIGFRCVGIAPGQ
jgi:formylglycine-generating enzyme required for sulfatase activity